MLHNKEFRNKFHIFEYFVYDINNISNKCVNDGLFKK